MNEKRDNIALVISFLSFVIAIVGTIQANITANKANTIAAESNKIAILSISPNLHMETKSNVLFGHFFYCKIEAPVQYQWRAVTSPDLTFSNNGGGASSLTSVQVSDSERSWDITILDSQNQAMSLPLDIPPGVSRRWQFRAEVLFTANSDSYDFVGDIMDNNLNTLSGKTLSWVFNFNNGKILNWDTSFDDVPSVLPPPDVISINYPSGLYPTCK